MGLVETQNLSAGVRKTIESIKEIVGNHSDADIYSALKEANMDPNETTQKLLFQDPFHEVRRRRDKKKEIQNEVLSSSTTPEPRRNFEQQVGNERKPNSHPHQNVRRSSYSRASGVSQQFRVVKDNRVDQNKETNLAPSSTPTIDPVASAPVNSSSSVGTSSNQKAPVGHQSLQNRNGPSHLHPRQSRGGNLVGTSKKVLSEDKLAPLPDAGTRLQNAKTNAIQTQSTTSSNSSAIGVYPSSSDPVHVPSRDSRQVANVGAIKREVGVVGARRQSSESGKLSSISSNLLSNHSQNVTPESTAPASSVGRVFSNNHYSSRAHQSVGHSKAPQPSKEWKPKLNQKAASNAVGAILSPTKADLSSDNSKNVETEATQLKDKHSPINASENQNVIIAAHIRVSESDRYRLTFGSLGAELETASSGIKSSLAAEASTSDHSVSVSVSAPVSSGGELAQIAELTTDRIQRSDSNSSVSASLPKRELADKKESTSSHNMDNYGDIGLIRDNNLAYSSSESQQQAYDQTGYNIPYMRPPADEAFRRQGLPSPQEALSSHTASSIPATTIGMGQQQQQQLQQQQQQQQQQLAQMYPQLHFMPYRQVFPPFYVPPMAMPGYSNNPAYPHPSNGSNYVLMPGGSSHLTAGSVKYGMQQFKPVPAGSPTGFGNYSNQTGYAINTPGVVGSGTGLEDASRVKYKDNNHLYVPNAQQADTSEMWMNTKEIPNMQSASYYNMPGQTTHATAYLPSHTGHPSYNAAAAAAQSSHMQFPAMYHAPQPGAIASPHPLGAAMVGNVGVSATAPLPQVGAYQQPQLGHLNWTGNL